LLQVLTPIFDPEFSEWSYGFRPGRGTQDAVLRAREYVRNGYRWVVDIDLEKFFDRVNHDALMARVARKVKDKGALRLIRRYLKAGVLIDGLTSPIIEGTPQGGPLSPLLSNIMLDDLDKELERRGHQFCRYADDCNVYVRSRRAGERLMASLTRFLEKRLKLKVNEGKSAVGRPWKRQFLGYSMTSNREPRLKVAPDREKRFKRGIRPLLRAGRGRSLRDTLKRAAPKIRGWVGYFRLCDVKASFERLDGWFRRRLRCILWRHWKRPKTRRKQLIKRGLDPERARKSAGNGRGPWWNAGASHMNQAVPTRELRELGLISFLEEFQRVKYSTG
jgi:group II intron reverse transcriptase/maturase